MGRADPAVLCGVERWVAELDAAWVPLFRAFGEADPIDCCVRFADGVAAFDTTLIPDGRYPLPEAGLAPAGSRARFPWRTGEIAEQAALAGE